MVKASLVTIGLLLTGCASNYQLGDFSTRYCSSNNAEYRAILKATANKYGIEIGIDYCTAHGLVDALIVGE